MLVSSILGKTISLHLCHLLLEGQCELGAAKAERPTALRDHEQPLEQKRNGDVERQVTQYMELWRIWSEDEFERRATERSVEIIIVTMGLVSIAYIVKLLRFRVLQVNCVFNNCAIAHYGTARNL